MNGIAPLTPEDVHLGQAVELRKARQSVLLKAWQAHPERFVCGTPRPPELEPITYINRSEDGEAA
jgi:putative transposase